MDRGTAYWPGSSKRRRKRSSIRLPKRRVGLRCTLGRTLGGPRARLPEDEQADRTDHRQETDHTDDNTDRQEALRRDDTDDQRDKTGNEHASRDYGTTTANAADIDAGRKLRIVLIERALDFVEHPLFVLGERHGPLLRHLTTNIGGHILRPPTGGLETRIRAVSADH